ncbi:MAG: aspartyl protease family protein [Pseudomonadota bacterium]
MGRIVAKVTVKNALDESKVRIFDALVDTGATLLTLPTAWKQDLGRFLTTEKEKVQLADQHEVDVEICGPLTIQLEGFRKINMDVAFVDMTPEDGAYEPLIGYIVLEQAGIAVDMIGHRLVAVKHLDLKRSGA